MPQNKNMSQQTVRSSNYQYQSAQVKGVWDLFRLLLQFMRTHALISVVIFRYTSIDTLSGPAPSKDLPYPQQNWSKYENYEVKQGGFMGVPQHGNLREHPKIE